MALGHERANAIRLVVFDVDGVFSDGRIYYNSQGAETKAFHVQDGLGVQLLKQADMRTAVITGRQSPVVTRRMDELGVDYVYQGSRDKLATLQTLCETLALTSEQVAYMGDDLPDLAAMQWVGLAFAPANAYWYIREISHYVTHVKSGEGAVREVSDYILTAQEKLSKLISHFGAIHA